MSAILYDYFQTEVAETAQQLDVEVPVDTQVYVADLLARYARSEHLFVAMEGRNELEPMALMLRRALDLEDSSERIQILRRMGDTALYTSGFFADRLERRGMEVDYYIEMGGRAYSSVSDLANGQSGRAFRALYAQLADRFRDLVRVLWELADRTRMVTPRGLLDMYRKWETTQSERYERKLVQSGFVLTPNARPNEC